MRPGRVRARVCERKRVRTCERVRLRAFARSERVRLHAYAERTRSPYMLPLTCSAWLTGGMTNATDLIRSVTLVGGLFAAACGALVSCAESVRPDAPTPTTLPAVVVVHDGEPADVQPPQRLDVVGLTPTECDDAGGLMVEGTCTDVDY